MLFSSLMLDEHHIRRFPALAGAAIYPTHPAETKALIYPQTLFAAQLKIAITVEAIAVPCFTEEKRSLLVPLTKSATLRALGPSSVYSSPWREKSRFDFYAEMLGHLPCYSLRLGSDIGGLVEPLLEYCA